MVVVTTDGRFIDANKAYCDLLGYSLDELKEFESFADITPERYREWELENIWQDRLLLKGYSGVYEKEYIRKDGTTVPVEMHGCTTFDKAGNPEHMWGIVRDITARKKTEEEMFLLISAIEQAGEMVVITNQNAEIVYVNPVFETTTGYSRDEVLGKNPSLLKSGLQTDEFYQELWKTLEAGKTWKGRFTNRKKDGSIYTDDSSISPVFSDNDTIVNYIAVKRDITETMTLEQEKQDIEKQFHQAQRMESIGRLAGGVAHDLNNLLAPILGYSELMMGKGISRQETLEAAQEITNAGIKARNIVKQLLAYSRKQTLEFQPLDLNQVLRHFNKLLRRTIREDIIIGMDLEAIRARLSRS